VLTRNYFQGFRNQSQWAERCSLGINSKALRKNFDLELLAKQDIISSSYTLPAGCSVGLLDCAPGEEGSAGKAKTQGSPSAQPAKEALLAHLLGLGNMSHHSKEMVQRRWSATAL